MDELHARRALERFGGDPQALQMPPLGKANDRAVWRAGDHVLKWVSEEPRAAKIAAASRYLHRRGVPVPPALPSADGRLFLPEGAGFYLLFPWVEGRLPHYDEPGMIEAIAAMLARFHRASEGYIAAGGPVEQWQLKWLHLCRDAGRRLRQVAAMAADRDDAFSLLFQAHLPWLEARIAWVLERLQTSGANALAALAQENPLLGHGDYSRQNLLVTPDGSLAVIDLDLVAVSLPIRDLSRLITWVAHDLQHWSGERFQQILTAYGELSGPEFELLLLHQAMPFLAIDIAREYYGSSGRNSMKGELERCLATDRDKLADLGVGPGAF